MLRYKRVDITVPANGEATVTAISIPDGQTYTISMIALDGQNNDQVNIIINGTIVAELLNATTFGNETVIPIGWMIKGPETIELNIKNTDGTGTTQEHIIGYEEK